eukprot:6062241-Prymnesium_polylepis.1
MSHPGRNRKSHPEFAIFRGPMQRWAHREEARTIRTVRCKSTLAHQMEGIGPKLIGFELGSCSRIDFETSTLDLPPSWV